MPGIVKGAMEMVGVGTMLAQVGIRDLLGVNQVPQVEIRDLIGASQSTVMIILDMVGAVLDVGTEAGGEEGILGTVDPHGVEEVTEMMNRVEKGRKIAGTGGILMVAEEEVEDALVEVIAIKVTTLGQETEMVVLGTLAGETETEMVVTKTGMTTMREGPSVKIGVVAGLNLLTGMPTKEPLKEIKLLQKASPAGGVTKMIAWERQNHQVEVIRQERMMETPGVKTNHLLAMESWVSGVLPLATRHLAEGDL